MPRITLREALQRVHEFRPVFASYSDGERRHHVEVREIIFRGGDDIAIVSQSSGISFAMPADRVIFSTTQTD